MEIIRMNTLKIHVVINVNHDIIVIMEHVHYLHADQKKVYLIVMETRTITM